MGFRVGVIGGSVAGLLAARSLRDIASEIVLFERDEVPTAPTLRKSAPQAAHAHVLLARGAELLASWFDDLFEELASEGCLTADISAANNWFHFGTWKRRIDSGVLVHFQSRLLLEHVIRKRVLAQTGVSFRRATVTTVEWRDHRPTVHLHDGATDTFDLLIDASGRGSKMLKWMADADYSAPVIERVEVNVTYTSARYRPEAPRDYQGLLVYPTPPDGLRAGGILPVERGDVLLSLFGWCGEAAQESDSGMLEYAQTLPQPDIAEFLGTAERLTDFRTFHYKEARRLRVDRATLPPRTCLMGDALCSVDPVFGQGMTLAALQAQELTRCFENGADLDKAAIQFNRRALSTTDTAWLLSTGEDFRYPHVEGKRPFGISLSHWYTSNVHRLVARDDDIYRRFARVMNLLEGPEHLFHPKVAAKVLLASLRPPRPVEERPTALGLPAARA